MSREESSNELVAWLPLAVLCVALNVALGTVVNIAKLPVYLDAVGTVTFALLVAGNGWRGLLWSIAVGVFSFVVAGTLFNPVLFWFVGTQAAIAAYSYLVAAPVLKSHLFGSMLSLGVYFRIVILGLGLGVVAGIASAPVIALVFGGITGAGASLITAFFLKAGETLFTSVLASGLASEPLDKLLQFALAIALVRCTPNSLRKLMRPD